LIVFHYSPLLVVLVCLPFYTPPWKNSKHSFQF